MAEPDRRSERRADRKRAATPPAGSAPVPLRPTGSVGYADLLLAYAAGGERELATVASLLGYAAGTPRPRAVSGKTEPQPEPDVVPAAESLAPAEIADVPFWMPYRRDVLQSDATPPDGADPATAQPDPPSSLALPGDRPPLRALAPWNALMPRLRAAFAAWIRGRALDLPPIISSLARADLLERLPRKSRRRWGHAVQIIVDRSEHLIPYYEDQALVLPHLAALFLDRAVELVLAIDGTDGLILVGHDNAPYRLPDAGTLVLVLGDLGCLARQPDTPVSHWAAFGQQVLQVGGRPCALTPCPRARWQTQRLRDWSMLLWDLSGGDARASPGQRQAGTDRLLRLISLAVRIEPGLLRDIRLLLGSVADAGTEADVWQHDVLIGRSSEAATLDPEAANRLRQEAIEQEPVELRVKVIELVRRWRGGALAREVWFQELRNLDPQTRDRLPEAIRTGDLPRTERFFIERAHDLDQMRGGLTWYRRVYRCGSPDFHRPRDRRLKAAQQQLYLMAYRNRQAAPPPPPNFEPGLVPSPPDAEQVATLRQIGGKAVVGEAGGSLLASVLTRNGLITLLPDWDDFWAAGPPPPWADVWGRDAHGAWVSFSIAARDGTTITQRMRWIPPGRFQMGSSDNETGRFDDEGPRHGVTIANGFWMFDTACSEGLWEAVTGKAPNPRRGAAFPVTGVSWEDARLFLRQLNAAKPGLDLDLPPEARWEYACRAGTDTPYSFGTTISRELACYESNAPVPVGSLPANGWGLHEMHGNVWEWCADPWHDNYQGAPADGSAWLDPIGAANRVVRGGSWSIVARGVRAAYRGGGGPANRVGDIGFRCARVQVASGAERAADPASRPGAERGRPQGPTSDSALLRVGEPAPLPRAGSLLIRTDREELRFRRATHTDPDLAWAGGIGRDRFGLFADVTLPDTVITQRLRWLPPGQFVMGSPETESGRWDAEGLQHEVTLASGFWLFDTPCTQALWEAVMGENPSYFRSPTRPVEQVSFNDAQAFLRKLNARVEGLNLSLPSEAQWEYACRAGTTTATYAGDMQIWGENNASVLDAIAWYGGNSGVGSELENGYDSSSWQEKQYNHTRAGTRAVAQKAANPWGLYDMLGNVWEWCADDWHDNYDGAPTDGSAWTNTGRVGAAGRVVRGGSWSDDARNVRAASRVGGGPALRGDGIGFRCARVQSDSVLSEAERRAGRSKLSERSEQAATTSPQRRERGAVEPPRKRKRT